MDARLIIGGVFGVVALAWILKSDGTSKILSTIGNTFAALVKPLMP